MEECKLCGEEERLRRRSCEKRDGVGERVKTLAAFDDMCCPPSCVGSVHTQFMGNIVQRTERQRLLYGERNEMLRVKGMRG